MYVQHCLNSCTAVDRSRQPTKSSQAAIVTRFGCRRQRRVCRLDECPTLGGALILIVLHCMRMSQWNWLWIEISAWSCGCWRYFMRGRHNPLYTRFAGVPQKATLFDSSYSRGCLPFISFITLVSRVPCAFNNRLPPNLRSTTRSRLPI